jgi:hypothetical protein
MRKEVLMNPLNNLVQECKNSHLNQNYAVLQDLFKLRGKNYRQARSKGSILWPLISINFKK